MPAVLREQEQLCRRLLQTPATAAGIPVCWGTTGLGQEQWMFSSGIVSKTEKTTLNITPEVLPHTCTLAREKQTSSQLPFVSINNPICTLHLHIFPALALTFPSCSLGLGCSQQLSKYMWGRDTGECKESSVLSNGPTWDIRDLQDSGSGWFRQVQVRVNDIFCHSCSTLFFPPCAVVTRLWAGYDSELPPLSNLQEEVLNSSGHT